MLTSACTLGDWCVNIHLLVEKIPHSPGGLKQVAAFVLTLFHCIFLWHLSLRLDVTSTCIWPCDPAAVVSGAGKCL